MAAPVKAPMTVQSRWLEPDPNHAASAVALLTVMTSSDVPTAIRVGKPSASTSAGTNAQNPPPTPKNPGDAQRRPPRR